MWYVYILFSRKTNQFYKGMTNDLERRIDEHYQGKEVTTKKLLPLQLIHVELCTSRKDARNLEKFFKTGFGREVIKEIAGVAEWQTHKT